MPTYFISGEEKIHSDREILHYNFHEKREISTKDWLGSANARLAGSAGTITPLRVLVTSGASCPDALVEAVIRKLAAYFDAEDTMDTLVAGFEA